MSATNSNKAVKSVMNNTINAVSRLSNNSPKKPVSAPAPKPVNAPPSYTNSTRSQGKSYTERGKDMVTNASKKVQKYANENPSIITLILVLFGFVIVAVLLGFMMRDYYRKQSGEPWLIEGTKTGQSQWTIHDKIIERSVDRPHGIEFTYSFWMFINSWDTKDKEWKHIFHKGNSTAIPLQSPGVWLYPKVNKMAINMNTFASVKETCEIGNIPIKKWVHVTITCMDRFMDVYINGNLKKRCKLKGVPKLNIGNLYINNWGGFDGFLSRFKYYNYAIPYWKIERLVRMGPSATTCLDTGAVPPYLSDRWWLATGFPEAHQF